MPAIASQRTAAPCASAGSAVRVRCANRAAMPPAAPPASRPTNTAATPIATQSQRVSRPSAPPWSTVRSPTSGTARTSATTAAAPASFTRRTMPSAPARALAPVVAERSAISDLLDLRATEQPGRPENQHQHQDAERSDVFVFDREVGRVERLDQADQEAAQHGARQRSDTAQHRGGERLQS